MTIQRIHSLDYLRGIMACAVMTYHCFLWTYGEFDSSTVLGRLGIYGVSFFYILSGLTLFIVYRDYSVSLQSLKLFGIKRVFRIFPLLWAVTIIYIIGLRISDVELIFLNLSGLFGFIKPEAYIGTGVWSIGNELVFYALFTLLFYFRKRNDFLFYTCAFLAFAVAVYFAFDLIDSSKSLEAQWKWYINPFNQFYFFVGGFLIGHITANYNFVISSVLAYAVMLGLTLVFCLYPVIGDLVNIVTGWERVVFSLICLAICFVVHIAPINMNQLVHAVLSFLGATSYSIYLMHPVVYMIIKQINARMLHVNPIWVLMLSLMGTVAVSFISYEYLEKPMIKVGTRIITQIKQSA